MISKLRTNIFSSIDKIGEDIIRGQKIWKSRSQQSSKEPNEGLLEVMHFLGDKIQYNILMFSLPSDWDEQLNDFYKKVYKHSPHVATQKYTLDVNNRLKNGQGVNGANDTVLFTDRSEEEAILFIHNTISMNISGGIRRDYFIDEQIDEIANSIYTSLSERVFIQSENWEENYANKSPISVLTPRLLSSQFNADEVFEGAKYCDYCGAEKSRSLMYSGIFIPFAGVENKEKDVVNYFGRIQDIEAEVLPLIQNLWEEQVEEFNRRDKKATKMWDSAEDRLIKKQTDEKERKRQAEIAKLEKKLKAIKNNDE